MRKKMFTIFSCTLFLFMFFPLFIEGQSRPFPRLTPDARALEFFAVTQRNTPLTWEELAEISLWASGDANIPLSMERVRSVVEALASSPELPVSGRERAEFILTFMHANVLRGYSRYQTRLDTVFVNGRFNCVSSAVLYMILCASAGIRTSGVITRDHAFIIVHVDGQNVDVETTNRFGFDPGSRREFHDEFGRLTGFTYVPAQNYHDRQTISQIELISVIFNNRVVDLERANRFAEAVPLAIDRNALLLGITSAEDLRYAQFNIFINPRRDLVDRLLNYGASLLRANREEDALLWAVTASAQYSDSDRWPQLIMAAVNNRVMRFLRGGNSEAARSFLEANRKFLSQDCYIEIDSIVLDAELLARANRIRTFSEGDGVVYDIQQAVLSGRLNQRRGIELRTFAVQKTAAVLCAAPDFNWRAAISYLESAIMLFGANREWEQTIRTYQRNLAADFHNRFAAEWNRRNFEKAVSILEAGLAEFPNDRQLLSNRDIVNRQQR